MQVWPALINFPQTMRLAAGTFTPQFQGNGCQVFSRSFHDDATNGGTTGKEDVIKFLGQQLLTDAGVSFEDGDIARIKDVSNHLRNHLGCMGSMLRGFEDGTVSSCDPFTRAPIKPRGCVPINDLLRR